jgi:asparagine synthase (glutamine-hydrolysing)
MCGFAGFMSLAPRAANTEKILDGMGNAIAPRGPDSSGTWICSSVNLGFSFRRLAIVDTSPAGAQPMSYKNLTIVFNGEIYNHLDLRKELVSSGCLLDWKGHSDTETLLKAFSVWGVEKTLKKAIGMFAFALWNEEQRTLCLSRDRFGEKPLYFGYQNGVLLFGSDLSALRRHPDFVGQLNRSVLPSFLRYHYIPAPHSIYRDLFKLQPGSTMEFGMEDFAAGRIPEAKAYWSLKDTIVEGRKNPFKGNFEDAKAELKTMLHRAIGRQMIADVPLGAFLSGGIDSSTVVSLMQSQSTLPVRTFTIGSSDPAFDESGVASRVAKHLGTNHTELIATPQDVMDVVNNLSSIYSEPFADLSQLPTFLVSKLARQHVTVALTGDAGDEIFGGYNRYIMGPKVWSATKRLPRTLRKALVRGLGLVSQQRMEKVARLLTPVTPVSLRSRRPGAAITKIADALRHDSEEMYYKSVVSRWKDPCSVLLSGTELKSHVQWPGNWDIAEGDDIGFVDAMMAMDIQTYLPDDILAKVDRASMANSLETRVPFLDHEIVEFAWRLPVDMKTNNQVGKLLLREIVRDYVPPEVLNQPKTGFGIPIGEWLRGQLRDWAEDLLSISALQNGGVFDIQIVRGIWHRHLIRQSESEDLLWPVLILQQWLRTSMPGVKQ